jgi:hypothetical protein
LLPGEAIGVFVGETEDDGLPDGLGRGHGILGEDAVFVFNLEGKIVGEEGGGLFENAVEFAGSETVVIILAHPHLQLAGVGLAKGASTIEEGFSHAPHLGDVEGHGNRGAVREKEAEGLPRMGLKEGL